MGESRPGGKMSRTGNQAKKQKAEQLMGLQYFPQCHPGPSAMLWQTDIPTGAVSSPVGPGLNIEPSKTADKPHHHPWQQIHEATGWHCENFPFPLLVA